ncbi:MAG: hypothetical protein ACT4P1_16050 [Sporichthyaceae bacterium]
MRVRRMAAALAVTAIGGGALALPGGSAGAAASYDAIARTETFTGTINNQSIPTGIDIEGGGPQAGVRQSSLGVSDASAQLPYAGETVPGLPAIGASLFNFPAPPYPFIAASNAGTPPQSVTYPGVSLQAESGDFATLAAATFGSAGSGANATARIDEARSGDVTANSATTADTVRLGPYVTLSDVRSLARVVANAGNGSLVRTTSSSIGRISVPGLVITIPESTPAQVPIPVPIPGVGNFPPLDTPPFPIPAGGVTLSDPDIGIQNGVFTVTDVFGGQKQTYAIPTESALAGFEAAGVTVKFQQPQKTKTGLVAGAYNFSYTIPAPPPNAFYTGATRISQTTAYALASVDLSPVPAGPVPATAGIADDLSDSPVAVPGVAARVVDAVVDPAQVPAVLSPDAAVLAPQSGAGTTADGATISLAGFKIGTGVDNLYLVVVAMALLGLVTVGAVSLLGVRSLWN